ncbi:hypothetical protein LHJ74_16515 [Streptomyces sp. N2-109]|uniref:Uncharacterized protein n=1 Tax=Streptomyces gossypii TaxID=2883101 RepID=A0ABT2JUB9_9ACTN|nr:hypothetical protein [Streptomyces gossypii]MCT2591486.1 hypothetical protein [Streptomyces gossypii]
MKSLLGFLSFILISQGLGGLLHELTGGAFHLWGLVHKTAFLEGFEIYVSLLLVVLGVAVGTAAGRARA